LGREQHNMKVLYIFPHPDDESFGPAHAMSKQRREGHEVYLLTLTKGGATKQRHKYGHSVVEMGEVRHKEMLDVARVLDLTGLTVLDLPDSGLKEMDPREIESVVQEHLERVRPDIVVTYAVHGISGFHDHVVTHAVVKRAYVEARHRVDSLRRLAFFTITDDEAEQSTHFPLSGSTSDEIDCVVEVDDVDIQASQRALDSYVTFQETIEKTGIRDFLHKKVVFELFQEEHDPPLTDLFAGLE
jgi:LmbE family N-acetylglucosaminyl deacetylase